MGSGVNADLAFAVVSGSPRAEGYLTTLCDSLTEALGRTVTPRVLSSYAALREEIEAGRAHVVWAPPLVALELADAAVASPDLCCTRSGRQDYHAAIFTRPGSPIETLADLRGRHMAWVDRSSAAGYVLPRNKLVAEGLDPASLFGKETFYGSHVRVAMAVLDGEADAGATYLAIDPKDGRPESAGWLEAGAAINSAVILATTGPIPADAISFSSQLPDELKGRLVGEVRALPSREAEAVGRLLRADGLVPTDGSHYAALRSLAYAGKPS